MIGTHEEQPITHNAFLGIENKQTKDQTVSLLVIFSSNGNQNLGTLNIYICFQLKTPKNYKNLLHTKICEAKKNYSFSFLSAVSFGVMFRQVSLSFAKSCFILQISPSSSVNCFMKAEAAFPLCNERKLQECQRPLQISKK